MFIGHYGPGLALKKVEPSLSAGWIFLATQFVDILWAILILLGIERVEIVPGITAANPLDLVYYPYSHSLVASLLWAAAIYALVRIFWPGQSGSQRHRRALVMALAVFSHFLIDLLVHRPDLPLFGNNSLKIGLGLWNYPIISFVLEALIFIGGLWLYLKATSGTTFGGKYGMIIFAVVLLILHTAHLFSPPPANETVLAALSLLYYLIFAGLAFWLDGKRQSRA